MAGPARVWRQGQRYSEDLRARVLAAVDGGMAQSAASVFRVSVSYICKALIQRRWTGKPERPYAVRSPIDAEAGTAGGPHQRPSGYHLGGVANLALGRACGAVE